MDVEAQKKRGITPRDGEDYTLCDRVLEKKDDRVRL
jgi:hypothetical protein